ncbi:ABC transporter ATP-binding protein [Shimazuella sp. AN120528]|uniref:ABC transporter ATP-binding protein n=1 Tax=Shimazuella soli TaxID=1892854 RepID=UPI001F0ECB5A|nr:ABC transporter ATP-binding protein [Shimazuella soli]MCH5586267.1 ABC transporter ATP-binding protein [Shimazuella soli]
MKSMVTFERVSKVYGEKTNQTAALKDVSFSVNTGEFVAIIGPSGSGKSTFLSMAGLLLSPTSGNVFIENEIITNLKEKDRANLRLQKIGFVFQASNLIPYLTVMDQLLLIGKLSRSRKDTKQKADRLLEKLGLSHRKHHFPSQLSGGEKQRVAIARAWMNDPQIILADEPTASLDSKRGREVVEMLASEIKRKEKAGIIVTHDERVLDLCDRVLMIKDGELQIG